MKKWLALLLCCLLCLCAAGAMAEGAVKLDISGKKRYDIYPNGYISSETPGVLVPHTGSYIFTGATEDKYDTPFGFYANEYGKESGNNKNVSYEVTFENLKALADIDCTAIRFFAGSVDENAKNCTITINLSSIDGGSVTAISFPVFSNNSLAANNNTVKILVHNVSGTLKLDRLMQMRKRIVSQGITLTYDTDDGPVTIDGNKEDDQNNAKDLVIKTISCQFYLKHVPTTATCTAAGKQGYYTCTICKRIYLNKNATGETTLDQLPTVGPLGHDLTHVDEVPSTCKVNGYRAHYACSNCTNLFEDADGLKETTRKALTLPAQHDLEKVPAKAPTCTEDGNKEYYFCKREGCGELFSDEQGQTPFTGDMVIKKQGHTLTPVPAKPATCTEEGNKEYYYCTREGCGELFSDEQGQTPFTGDKVIKKLGHKLTPVPAKAPTCTEDGYEAYYVCTRCQELFADENATMALPQPKPIPAEEHDFGEDWQSDGEKHWHACDCGERSGEAEHSFVTVVDRKPGETEPGEQHEECSVCGYRKAAVSIPAVGRIDLPQTGDSSHLLGWLAMLGACCAGLWCVSRRRG